MIFFYQKYKIIHITCLKVKPIINRLKNLNKIDRIRQNIIFCPKNIIKNTHRDLKIFLYKLNKFFFRPNLAKKGVN